MAEKSPTHTVTQGDPGTGIREGDTVILDVNGEKQAFLTVRRAGCVLEPCLLHAKSGDKGIWACAVHRPPPSCLQCLTCGVQQSKGWQAALRLGAYHWSTVWQCVSSDG